MNELKEQQLTWAKGMSNVPSDLLCNDNTSEVEVNMIYRNGEHRPIQNERVMFHGQSLNPVLFVHKYNGYVHYIARNGSRLMWYQESKGEDAGFTVPEGYAEGYSMPDDLPDVGDDIQIQAVGNTLIVNDGASLRYALWKPATSSYKYLGDHIPDPQVRVGMYLKSYFPSDTDDYYETNEILHEGGYIMDTTSWTNLAKGAYAALKKKVAKLGAFINPFAIRYAVKMYDGEYTNISIPIIMYPCIGANFCVFQANYSNHDGQTMHLLFREAYLCYKQLTDYSEWEDLVSGVSFFCSRGVDIWDTTGEANFYQDDVTFQGVNPTERTYRGVEIKNIVLGALEGMRYTDGEFTKIPYSLPDFDNRAMGEYSLPMYVYSSYRRVVFPEQGVQAWKEFRKDDFAMYPFARRSTKHLNEELRGESIFYKVYTGGLVANTSWKAMDILPQVLENLETQTILDDDYYSHCAKKATGISVYNKRLHMTGVSRGFYEGSSQYMGYEHGTKVTGEEMVMVYEAASDVLGDYAAINDIYYTNGQAIYCIFFYIHTSNGDRIVKKRLYTYECLGNYIYYPDPRTYKVEIYRQFEGSKPLEYVWKVIDFSLKPSENLNGASYIGEILQDYGKADWTEVDSLPEESTEMEYLPGQLWVSEVNNPWVFKAAGNVTVGNEDIMAVSTITTALSQGQFGSYPLICFCTDGVWALALNTEGYYNSVSPMSREVCDNTSGIVQTDSLIYFPSEKGLMVINGNQITCASPHLSGKNADTLGLPYNDTIIKGIAFNLHDFLKSCRIGYDYRDQLLWVMRENCNYMYVYSIADGTFAVKKWDSVLWARSVNNYPDTFIQDTEGRLYTLLNRVDINTESDAGDISYNTLLVSRPMKWENSTALKSLMRLKLMFLQRYSKEAHLTLYASNDCKCWVRVFSLGGRGYKFWKFRLSFPKMSATDTLSGAIIQTQERYTWRPR